MTSSRPFAILALVGAAVMVAASAPAGGTSSARPALSAGMVVRGSGLTLVVPAPGHGVFASAARVDGGGRDWLGVVNRSDGTVVVLRRPVRQRSTARAGTGACTDGAYALEGTTWATELTWSFNSGSTPSELSWTQAQSGLKNGASHMETGYNDCGLADQVSATESYLGTTTSGVNITRTASCGTADGKSVVGFGTLPTGILAFTCWWTDGSGTALQADIRLNKAHYKWTTSTTRCTSSFLVAAAATHEFGHVFGLAHVDQAAHPKLTMHPVIASCQSSESTLGLGDVLGLEDLY